jgi:hypothetical protein
MASIAATSNGRGSKYLIEWDLLWATALHKGIEALR